MKIPSRHLRRMVKDFLADSKVRSVECGVLAQGGVIRRGQWVKKTMEVKMGASKPGFCLNDLKSHDLSPKPRCRCPICILMDSASVHSCKELQTLVKTLELVEHSPQSFTFYDKTRPWLRKHVHNCTNPRPLARRMPPLLEYTGVNEAANKVYFLKMMYPGKVIKDPKNINKN